MSKFKLDHGISRVRRTKLQSSIDQAIAEDIELLAKWSNNESNYVVNELLRFALMQEEDFQKFKASSAANAVRSTNTAKPAAAPIKSTVEGISKPEPAVSGATNHA